MRIRNEINIPSVTQSWFAQLCSALDSQMHDLKVDSDGRLRPPGQNETKIEVRLVSGSHLATGAQYDVRSDDSDAPSHIEIKQWNNAEIEIAQSDSGTSSSIAIARDESRGIRTLTLVGESSHDRTRWSGEFDANKWFESKSDALTGRLTNRFGLAEFNASVVDDRGTWHAVINVNVHGTGILRPFTSLALALFGRRIQRSVEKAVGQIGERIATEVQAALDKGPAKSATDILLDLFNSK